MLVRIKGLLHSSHFGTALFTAIIIAYPLIKHNIDIIYITYCVISIITSTMIGFLVNDIVDIERDRINKPFRPHINKVITKKQALVFCGVLIAFFIFALIKMLFYSLTSIFILIYFLFYIIYNYVNKINGLLKNITISFGFIFPYLFVITLLKAVAINFFLIVFTFLFFLYRELLMDINDKIGDLKTGLMTIPARVSDSTARFIVAIYWMLTVTFMLVHTFLFPYDYINVSTCFVIIIILSVQNLIWNNIDLEKDKMQILLMSMWIPMALSVLMIKS